MDPTGPRAHVMQHRFFFLPEIPSPPFATPAAALDAVGPCGALQSSTLPLESSWCGSTLPSHDFSVLSLGLGLPFLAAITGRVALPVVH